MEPQKGAKVTKSNAGM